MAQIVLALYIRQRQCSALTRHVSLETLVMEAAVSDEMTTLTLEGPGWNIISNFRLASGCCGDCEITR